MEYSIGALTFSSTRTSVAASDGLVCPFETQFADLDGNGGQAMVGLRSSTLYIKHPTVVATDLTAYSRIAIGG